MKLTDIIALAKAGYTVAEVKELMALETEPKQPAQLETEPKQPAHPETEPKQHTQPETEPKQPAQPETEPKQPAQPETDYKALYEQAQNDLKIAQQENIKLSKKEQDKTEDEDKLLADLVSSFI